MDPKIPQLAGRRRSWRQIGERPSFRWMDVRPVAIIAEISWTVASSRAEELRHFTGPRYLSNQPSTSRTNGSPASRE
jgi:hypothetical protein